MICSMDWFLYDNGPRHERVKKMWLLHFFFFCVCSEVFEAFFVFHVLEWFKVCFLLENKIFLRLN